jgi:DNA-binding NarL/FixJ family response regulator
LPLQAESPVPQIVSIDGRLYRIELHLVEQPSEEEAPDDDGLTPREIQVAQLVANGLVNKQIADRLGISEHTVATHIRRIFTKLGVDTRAAMVSVLSPLLLVRGGRGRVPARKRG